jgi:hypothetical protein
MDAHVGHHTVEHLHEDERQPNHFGPAQALPERCEDADAIAEAKPVSANRRYRVSVRKAERPGQHTKGGHA